jgi:PAS domain S-box-containing protein
VSSPSRSTAVQPLSEGEAELRAITDALPVLVSFIGPDQRYRFVNAAYERWFGHRKEDLVGKHLEEVLGAEAYAAILPHVERALRGEAVTFEAEVPYTVGGLRAVEASYLPLEGPGGTNTGFVALVSDTTEKMALERFRDAAIDRAVRLLKITSAIANAVTEADVLNALVDRVADAIDATSAGLFLVSDDRQQVRLARSFGYSERARGALAVVPLDAEPAIPALDAIRRGEPIWIASLSALIERYPHLEPIARASKPYRVACMPLVSRQRAVGALAFTFDAERDATEEERAFLLVIANYASQALERLRLLEAERRSRAEADAAAHRLRVLSRASRAFVDADLDLDSRLRSVVSELSIAFDSCINLGLLEPDGVIRLIAVHHPIPEADAALRGLAFERPVPLGEGVTGAVAATGRSGIIPSLDPAAMRDRAPADYREFLARFPAYAVIAAPLKVHGRVIGTVTAARVREGESYSEDDLRLLEELADRAAVSIENARLYQETVAGRARAEQLHRFAQVAVGAKGVDAVCEAALAVVQAALGVTRSAILTLDQEGVMRVRATRGLSDAHRSALEGYSPWRTDDSHAAPLLVPDVGRDERVAALAPIFEREGVRAAAMFPLVAEGRLLGTLGVLHSELHEHTTTEIETAGAIANYLASMIGRFTAIAKLDETIRYNELFTGVLAHDLRNPLGAIMMAAQLMQHLAEDDRLLKPLQRITRSGERMSRMIDQLLDFTQARLGGGIPVSRKEANLEQLAKHAIDEAELTTTGWRFELRTAGDLLGRWDPDRIAQVFSNLAGNAVQHGSPERPLVVALDGTKPESVGVEIRNRGVVRPEILPAIFEPFRTTHQKRDGTKGLGLGLYITKEVVRAHGGSIVVTSSEDEGTAFRITLPRGLGPKVDRAGEASTGTTARVEKREARWQALSERPLVSGEHVPTDGRPVFIVDDDRDIREALTETLEDRGVAVITAKNGREALDLLRSGKEQPSAILLDLMMPVMDGYVFLEEKRRDPAIAGIPVAVITAGHGIDQSRLGESVRVVPKPIDVAALMTTLRELRAEGGG